MGFLPSAGVWVDGGDGVQPSSVRRARARAEGQADPSAQWFIPTLAVPGSLAFAQPSPASVPPPQRQRKFGSTEPGRIRPDTEDVDDLSAAFQFPPATRQRAVPRPRPPSGPDSLVSQNDVGQYVAWAFAGLTRSRQLGRQPGVPPAHPLANDPAPLQPWGDSAPAVRRQRQGREAGQVVAAPDVAARDAEGQLALPAVAPAAQTPSRFVARQRQQPDVPDTAARDVLAQQATVAVACQGQVGRPNVRRPWQAWDVVPSGRDGEVLAAVAIATAGVPVTVRQRAVGRAPVGLVAESAQVQEGLALPAVPCYAAPAHPRRPTRGVVPAPEPRTVFVTDGMTGGVGWDVAPAVTARRAGVPRPGLSVLTTSADLAAPAALLWDLPSAAPARSRKRPEPPGQAESAPWLTTSVIVAAGPYQCVEGSIFWAGAVTGFVVESGGKVATPAGGGTGTFTPSLDYSDARNSQYAWWTFWW